MARATDVVHLGGGAAQEGALSFTIIGDAALRRRLEGLPRKIENACLRRALRTAGTKVKADLKAGTPVRSGEAKRAVNLKVRVSGAASFTFAGGSTATRAPRAYAVVKYKGHGTPRHRPALYMRIYEQGGSRQGARPFMRRALGNWEETSMATFRRALREAVESVEGIV